MPPLLCPNTLWPFSVYPLHCLDDISQAPEPLPAGISASSSSRSCGKSSSQPHLPVSAFTSCLLQLNWTWKYEFPPLSVHLHRGTEIQPKPHLPRGAESELSQGRNSCSVFSPKSHPGGKEGTGMIQSFPLSSLYPAG